VRDSRSNALTSRPLRVELGDRSYEIHVGSGLLERAGDLIAAAAGGGRRFVVTHPAIERLHGESLRRGLGAVPCETILVPSGERQKSLRRAAALWDALQAGGADRRSVVVAFGGGVIGDLAGFAAAAYMRGIAYVQIPTTLLAQVDSSVGGKVAVNHPAAKNLIGAFHQPRLVLADAAVLQTLRARDYRSGLAEVVKHAAIADAEMFAWLETETRAAAGRESSAIARMVRRSCEIKAEVVRRDERESGLRAVLNFGHTVGHGLESVMGYSALRHGEGVAIGMVAAARIGRHLGMCSAEVGDRLAALLESLRLPTRIPGTPLSGILNAMRSDKKAVDGSPRFVLPRDIGTVQAGCEAPPKTVSRVLVELGASTAEEE
jgi:3-dehydroquinate synthase